MAEGGQNSQSDRLNCSICLEPFKQPKLLPCHHSFCAVCLEDYIERTGKNGKFECALCRRSADVPSNGVDGFQSNFYIESEEGASPSTTIPCDICGMSKKAEHRCLDCEENFCDSCTTSHMKMKVSRHHKMEDLSTTDPSKRKIIAREFCQKHPSEEIKVVCKDCDMLLCLVCSITNHQNHTSRDIADEAKEIREKLMSALQVQSVKESIATLQRNVETREGHDKTLSDCLQKDLQQVDAREDTLIKVVKSVAEEFRKDVKERYKTQKSENLERLRSNQRRYESKSFLLKKMELALKEENDVTVVRMRSTFEGNITQVSDQKESEQEEVVFLPKQKVFYILKDISKGSLREMFGEVFLRREISRKEIKTATISQFSIEGHGIYGIAPVTGDKAWVSGEMNPELKLVRMNGTLISTVRMPNVIETIAADADGNCYVSCPSSKCIYYVSVSGNIQTVLMAQEDDICGISCSPFKQDVIYYKARKTQLVHVVTKQKGLSWNSVPFAKCNVMGQNRIAVHIDCICITGRHNGVMEVLDQSGKSVARIDESKKYKPLGVCFDHDGCILVVDCKSNSILRFTPKGELLQVLIKNLKYPRSVAVDADRRLWVGMIDAKILVYKLF